MSGLDAEPLADLQTAGEAGRGFRSCISAPIEFDAKVVGVITIYSSRSVAFNEDSEAIARSISAEIAPALDRCVSPPRSGASADRVHAVAVV